MTLGCIEYIGKPMYEALAIMLPKLKDEVLMNLELNKSEWSNFTSSCSAQEVIMIPTNLKYELCYLIMKLTSRTVASSCFI